MYYYLLNYQVYNLPAPFDAGCETIDGIYDSLDFHTFYSEGSCYMETLTKLTIEKCGCKYFLHKGVSVCRCVGVSVCRCVGVSVCRCVDVGLHLVYAETALLLSTGMLVRT